MKIEEVISQLESLMEDRKSFLSNDGGDEIFRADVEALQEAIEIIKESKTQNSSNKEEMRTFETGAKRSIEEGKGRYDLLPWEAIHELAIHCEEGALKYGERNCEKGIPIHSLLDSAIRHLSCYMRGMKDEPHLRAAMWNIAFAIWMEKNKPEMQDIPTRKEDGHENNKTKC